MYELFELFATVKSVEGYFEELDKDVWPCWERRMEFLFSKPAIRHAWQSHLKYAGKIYKPEFLHLVENMMAQNAPPSVTFSKIYLVNIHSVARMIKNRSQHET